jgi:hypothetical protein
MIAILRSLKCLSTQLVLLATWLIASKGIVFLQYKPQQRGNKRGNDFRRGGVNAYAFYQYFHAKVGNYPVATQNAGISHYLLVGMEFGVLKGDVFREAKAYKKRNGGYNNQAGNVGRNHHKAQIDKLFLDNEVVNNKVHYPVATRVNGAASQVIIHLFAYPSAKQGIKKVQYVG